MESRPEGRRLEIATAFALGLVSLVTALGVLQGSLWSADASRFGDDAADARDQSISRSVVAQLRERADLGAALEAARLARLQDEALADADVLRATELAHEIERTLGTAYHIPAGGFEAWREAGFPEEGNPVRSAEYRVSARGDADALVLASQRLGGLAEQLTARAGVFGQAALVHALALFLFGVAGINRLRMTRYVTLGMGAAVFAFGLFLMSTAY